MSFYFIGDDRGLRRSNSCQPPREVTLQHPDGSSQDFTTPTPAGSLVIVDWGRGIWADLLAPLLSMSEQDVGETVAVALSTKTAAVDTWSRDMVVEPMLTWWGKKPVTEVVGPWTTQVFKAKGFTLRVDTRPPVQAQRLKAFQAWADDHQDSGAAAEDACSDSQSSASEDPPHRATDIVGGDPEPGKQPDAAAGADVSLADIHLSEESSTPASRELCFELKDERLRVAAGQFRDRQWLLHGGMTIEWAVCVAAHDVGVSCCFRPAGEGGMAGACRDVSAVSSAAPVFDDSQLVWGPTVVKCGKAGAASKYRAPCKGWFILRVSNTHARWHTKDVTLSAVAQDGLGSSDDVTVSSDDGLSRLSGRLGMSPWTNGGTHTFESYFGVPVTLFSPPQSSAGDRGDAPALLSEQPFVDFGKISTMTRTFNAQVCMSDSFPIPLSHLLPVAEVRR